MTDQYAVEKRWVFSFDLKEESEDKCLTERGREVKKKKKEIRHFYMIKVSFIYILSELELFVLKIILCCLGFVLQIFIDRDPKLFSQVLSFLRTKEVLLK